MADTAAQQGAEDDVFTFQSAANKEFPLCPEGMANVTVVSAKLKMKTKSPKYLKAGEDPNRLYPHASLKLETDKTYEEDGQKKKHNVFYNMKISDHKKSVMFDFFESALGITVPVDANKNISFAKKVVKMENGDVVEYLPQFEKLQFSALIKHKKSEDGSKTFDNVESIVATPEQKKANASLFSAA